MQIAARRLRLFLSLSGVCVKMHRISSQIAMRAVLVQRAHRDYVACSEAPTPAPTSLSSSLEFGPERDKTRDSLESARTDAGRLFVRLQPSERERERESGALSVASSAKSDARVSVGAPPDDDCDDVVERERERERDFQERLVVLRLLWDAAVRDQVAHCSLARLSRAIPTRSKKCLFRTRIDKASLVSL